jgi:branched-chain amino acid transport system substrate-binding protein
MAIRGGAGICVLSAAVSVFAVTASCHSLASLEDCASDQDCATDQRCNPDHRYCELDTRPIDVGVVLPLTGGAIAGISKDTLNGMEVAAAQINTMGGVLGRPINLIEKDSESSEDLAEKLTRDLVAQGVYGVLGSARSSDTLRMGAATKDAHVVVITPVAGSTALAESQPARDRYLFQTVTSIRRGSGLTMSVFGRTWPTTANPCKRMAIVRSADQVPPGYREAIEEYWPSLGGCLVPNVEIEVGKEEAAYDPYAQQLLDAHPDCAALATSAVTGARFARSVLRLDGTQKKLGPNFFFLGQTANHTDDFLNEMRVNPEQAAPSYGTGILGADIDTNPDTEEAGEFRVLFNDHFGQPPLTPPPPWAANGYDAVAVLALAIEQAKGARDRVRLRDAVFEVANDGAGKQAFGPGHLEDAFNALRRGDGVNYTGASGSIAMDDYGVVKDRSLIWRVDDAGAFETIRKYSEDETQAALDAGKPGPVLCP